MLPLHNAAIFHFTGAEGRGRTDTRVASQQFLRLSRLPIPPLRLNWSGRRDSNSRHPPWQGGILPLNYFRPFYQLYYMVPKERFELSQACAHHPLKMACLPASTTSADTGITKNKNGRSGRIRTRDRWFWRPLLYQLSYTPIRIKFTILEPENKVLNAFCRLRTSLA